MDALDINIGTLNVRGLNSKEKRSIVYSWIKKNSYHICMLQETYCTESNKVKFKKGWRGDVIHSCTNSTHSRGVSILLSRKLNYTVIDSHSDNDGRIILVNLEMCNKGYTLVNIYAPNIVSERIAFFQKLREFINLHSLNKNRLIVGGDFNCVLNTNDRTSGIIDKSSNVLTEILDNFDLVDVWKYLNPELVQFTYIDSSPRMCNSRIDLLLLSKCLRSLCCSSKIDHAPVPDHKVVSVHLQAKVNDRGKGYWKINNNLLKSKEYEEGISELIQDVILEYGQHVSKSFLWDYLKIKIKEYSIAFSIKLAQNKKDKVKSLESLLDSLDKELTEKKDESIFQKRQDVKMKLDEIYKDIARGYQIRSRARWVEEGEQSSKYFLRLESNRQNYNCITTLKASSGITVDTDNDILDVAKTFYSDLYTSRTVSNEDMDLAFNSLIPENILSPELQQKCEGLLAKDECFRAVKLMKRNKSPGLDGISIEFYEHFWPLIGDLLVDTYNESFENKILPDSQRSAVLSLIFKKGDTEDITNYRPISLTNVDYRILAFVLAARMQSVINSIVSHDQTAYIKNRYMGYNIRLVDDVVEYYDHMQKKGLLFMADFSKAFDSLEWKFLFKTLDFFNFGPSFNNGYKQYMNNQYVKLKIMATFLNNSQCQEG